MTIRKFMSSITITNGLITSPPVFSEIATADLPGGLGTVTSVGLTMPGEFSVGGSPVTATGGFIVTKVNQGANTVYAGPTSGPVAAPTFRALVAADVAPIGIYPATTADLTGQTGGATVVAVTTPNDGVSHQYSVGGYVTITAVTLDVLQLQVGYTDETSTSRSVALFPIGTTSVALSAVGVYLFPQVIVRAAPNTTITLSTSLTTGTGSIGYDVGGSITRLN